MPADDNPEPMTAAQVREALAALPDDTIVQWTSWDSEGSYNYLYGIKAVGDNGFLRGLLIGGWYDGEEDGADDPDEEQQAEADTADAESADTLYHSEYPEFSPDGNPEDYTDNAKQILAEGNEMGRKFPNGLPEGWV